MALADGRYERPRVSVATAASIAGDSITIVDNTVSIARYMSERADMIERASVLGSSTC